MIFTKNFIFHYIANQGILDILTSYVLIQLRVSTWPDLPKNSIIKDEDIELIHRNSNKDRAVLNKVIQLIQSNKFSWKNSQIELSLSKYLKCT